MARYYSADSLVEGAYNCLMYALKTENKEVARNFNTLLQESKDVPQLFEETCSKLQLKVRRVNSLSEAKIAIAWWPEWEKDDECGFPYTDYHVIRNNNGVWMQKPGYQKPPNQLSTRELNVWASGGVDDVKIAYYSVIEG